ncbi:MAG: ABC transporter substrate-binding protein [Anaerosomatales bacterium]|nr:ABC transporter substrate-binding protein [Anaerosomatales bacterium]
MLDLGTPYRASVAFSWAVSVDPELEEASRADGTSPVSIEVVAPSGDGRFWVVDHPVGVRPRARVRLLSKEGEEESAFVFDELATLFTPGPDLTLWAVKLDAETGAETVVAYDSEGGLIGQFDVPERVLSRAIVFGRGGVYVLNDEWAYDPQSKETLYAGALSPVAVGGPSYRGPTAEEAEPIAGAIMFDANDNLYRVEPADSGAGFPLRVEAPDGRIVASIAVPSGYRPFAADTAGRVFAEGPKPVDTDAPGRSTIGDGAGERATLKVLDPEGTVATIQVPRISGVWGWTPPAWLDSDGTLVSWDLGSKRADVLLIGPDEAADHRTASAAPVTPDLRVVHPSEPESGDPYRARDAVERDLFQLVYSGLVSFDANLTPMPEMVEDIPTRANGGVSEDGLTLSYELRAGQLWHDGTPVTAEDVVATWRYLKENPVAGPPSFPGFASITGVRAEGLALTVTLSEPFGAGPECFFPFVLPAQIVSDNAGLLNGGLAAAPLGSGPFKLVRWEAGSRWLLESTGSDGLANLRPRTIEVRFASGDAGRQAYLSAEASVWSWVGTEEAQTLARDGLGTVIESATGRWVGSVLDTREDDLADKRIREALIAVYPFELLRDSIYDAEPAPVDPFPPGTAAHSAETETSRLDAQVASETLDAADVAVTLAHTSRGGLPELAPEHPLAVEEAWSEAGVAVKRAFATPRFYSSWWFAGWLSAQDHSVSIGVYPGHPDAGWGGVFDITDAPSVENPWGQGVDAGDDRLLRQLFAEARSSYDSDERDRLSREISARLVEERLAIFDYYEKRQLVWNSRVEGVRPGPYPAGDFWNVADWRIAESPR